MIAEAQSSFWDIRARPRLPASATTKKVRPNVQARKDELRAAPSAMLNPPKWLGSVGIQATRAWLAQQEKAQKILRSERASVPQLEAAVNAMSSASANPLVIS